MAQGIGGQQHAAPPQSFSSEASSRNTPPDEQPSDTGSSAADDAPGKVQTRSPAELPEEPPDPQCTEQLQARLAEAAELHKCIMATLSAISNAIPPIQPLAELPSETPEDSPTESMTQPHAGSSAESPEDTFARKLTRLLLDSFYLKAETLQLLPAETHAAPTAQQLTETLADQAPGRNLQKYAGLPPAESLEESIGLRFAEPGTLRHRRYSFRFSFLKTPSEAAVISLPHRLQAILPLRRSAVRRPWQGDLATGQVIDIQVDADSKELLYLIRYQDQDLEHATLQEIEAWAVHQSSREP